MEPISARNVTAPAARPTPSARSRVTGMLARLVPDAWQPSQAAGGFAGHIRDALKSNGARREIYAARSQGASRALSDSVIRFERLTLPLAMAFDAHARRFQKAGIPIVQRDLVSMDGVKAPDTPPSHHSVAGTSEVRRLETWLSTYRKDVSKALDGRDFQRVADLTQDLLERVDGLEASADAHFAMTKHVAESVGYAALHAVDYHAASHGQTDDLAARFVRLQAFGLTGTVSLDRRAQALQRQGIGILVNDLPHIPFVEEWQARKG